jgi:hypothetical protein
LRRSAAGSVLPAGLCFSRPLVRAVGGRRSVLEHQHGADGVRCSDGRGSEGERSRAASCAPVGQSAPALLISVVASFVASNGVLPWDSVSTVCFLTCTDGLRVHGVVEVRRTRNASLGLGLIIPLVDWLWIGYCSGTNPRAAHARAWSGMVPSGCSGSIAWSWLRRACWRSSGSVAQ